MRYRRRSRVRQEVEHQRRRVPLVRCCGRDLPHQTHFDSAGNNLAAMIYRQRGRLAEYFPDDHLHFIVHPAQSVILDHDSPTRQSIDWITADHLLDIAALETRINGVFTPCANRPELVRHLRSPGRLRQDCLSVPPCPARASPPAHVGCGSPPGRALRPLGRLDRAVEVGEEGAGEDWARRLSCRRHRRPLPQTSSRTYQRHLSSSA